MPAILTITLNPTVDFATTAPEIVAGPKLRCTAPDTDPGGGGINVARAIRLLGGEATALVAIGGSTGAELLELLAFEGVATVAIQGPGETRRSVSVIDESTGKQYRFVMPGPDWTEAAVGRALDGVDRAAPDAAFVVLSGSQPPGVAKDFPGILADHVAGRKAKVIVDTSGEALQHLAKERHEDGLYLLRMNVDEAEDLAGRPLPGREDTAAFARELASRGVAELIVIARGGDGNVLASKSEAWHSAPPPVEVRSAVGAGDSFVGAFALWASRGEPVQNCLRAGGAAASATCTTEGTRLCDPDQTKELYDAATLARL